MAKWRLRYYLDTETGLPHIYDHGVTEEEVEQVLAAPGEEFAGGNDSRIALGQSASGRYLEVCTFLMMTESVRLWSPPTILSGRH